jgi:predicted exporter
MGALPKHPWLLLATWLAILALMAAWSALTIRPSTDLSQFLPRAASQEEQILISQVRDGIAARTILLRIASPPGVDLGPEALAAASRALADHLRHEPAFVQVVNGDFAAIAGETDALLFRYRYLIGPTEHCAGSLNEDALRNALEQRLDELASGLAILDKQRLAADPTACYRALLRTFSPSDTPKRRHGVWLSPDGRHAVLVAVTKAGASDVAAQRQAVETIERAFAADVARSGLTLELAGPGYYAVSSENVIKSETILLSSVASIGVAVILASAFRSATLVFLGLLPLASGVLVGTLLVSFLFGSVHGITLALGVTLLGVALDYPVHIYAHVDGTAAKATGQSIAHPLFLGMGTSVLGYAALAWTSFDGLSQLGILAAAGLATAALTSRYLLPPLLPTGYRRPEHHWITALDRRLPRLTTRAGFWLFMASLVALCCTILLQDEHWETDIRRLSVIPQHELDKDTAIRSQLGAPDVARLLYVIAEDEASVLERIEAARPDLDSLRERGLIDSDEGPDRWLPSPRTQRWRQTLLPGPEPLTTALATANEGLPIRLDRLVAFLDDVDASRTLAPLETHDLAGTLIGTRLAMLSQPLGDHWLGLVPLAGVAGEPAVAALKELAERNGMGYLDLRQGTAAILSDFFAKTLDKLLIVATIIVLALALALRSKRRLMQVLLPIAVALNLTLMSVILMHGAANLFHLISLLLVAGLAIDYSLFLSRPVIDPDERRRTLFSVSVGASSSVAMFALLGLSDIPALNAIGSTVTIGILSAYPLSLLLARSEHKPLN